MIHDETLDVAGRPLTIETGKVAWQASGAVTVRYGDTIVLATAVASKEPRHELPNVPPVAQTPGLEGFEAWPWQGLTAPAGTPAAIIDKLHDTYVAAVLDTVVRQKLIDAGLEPLQSTPKEMAEYRNKEAAKWAEVIKTANISLD